MQCDIVISGGLPGPLCVSFDLCAVYLVMFGQSRDSEFGEERCEFCRLVIRDQFPLCGLFIISRL